MVARRKPKYIKGTRKKKKSADEWIQGAIRKPGAFTEWCKKQGFPGATEECIKKGLKSKNPTIRRRAALARTLKKMSRKKKGGKKK